MIRIQNAPTLGVHSVRKMMQINDCGAVSSRNGPRSHEVCAEANSLTAGDRCNLVQLGDKILRCRAANFKPLTCAVTGLWWLPWNLLPRLIWRERQRQMTARFCWSRVLSIQTEVPTRWLAAEAS